MIKVIYIDGWNVRSYIEHIEKYLGCQFDYVIYNIVLFLSTIYIVVKIINGISK